MVPSGTTKRVPFGQRGSNYSFAGDGMNDTGNRGGDGFFWGGQFANGFFHKSGARASDDAETVRWVKTEVE